MFTIVFKSIASLIYVSINHIYPITLYFLFKTVYAGYSGWQSSLSECKLKHNSYPLGDVDLTHPAQACDLIHKQPTGPSWIGIAKELYISYVGGNFQL